MVVDQCSWPPDDHGSLFFPCGESSLFSGVQPMVIPCLPESGSRDPPGQAIVALEDAETKAKVEAILTKAKEAAEFNHPHCHKYGT